MNTLVEENYLKSLFILSSETGEVSVNELSKRLNIKMPTVNSMMKKLSDKKLVHYESYKPLRLTDKGKKEAGLIIRKHRLTEMFLVEKMGFGWEGVHEIAEQIEHLQSPVFFEKMDAMLGFPTVDPHGSPIPDRNGKLVWKNYRMLSKCETGDSIIISAVLDSSAAFLSYLNSKELKLGVKLKIVSVETFDGTMIVNYGKRKNEVLSKTITEKLLTD